MNKYISILLLTYISTYWIGFISVLHNNFITTEIIQFLIINFIIYFLISKIFEFKDKIFLLIFSTLSLGLHIISNYLSHLWGYTEKMIDKISQPMEVENETVIMINIIVLITFLILYLINLLIQKYVLKKNIKLNEYFKTLGILTSIYVLDFGIFFIINIFLILFQIRTHGL